MTPERWQRAAEAFEAALELNTEQRSAFLSKLSPDDASLRGEVEALLAEDAVQAKTPQSVIGAATLAGKRIGCYKVVRVIGEGGMGVVFEAEQEHPCRIIALKVIKPGYANAELSRRFERESEVLARLQHPGIAQIYEAGAAQTAFGPQAYFAMELIHGMPLREYAESQRLGTRQRLELLAKVCDAVEHAHQRGIIHRDLKPANILVDEIGQPKILDFGVARVTDSDVQATRQTDIGQLVGTLAYMSPEQVTADPLELDTRSDVYALGVILYELLANRLPYQLSHQLPEAVRAIREEDPTRLSSISRAYQGDVETIVAKALEKDKGRRYSSAAALATDIRRYLADEPILARPASTSYQLRKFARRHKALVMATAAIFVVLIGGIIVTTWQAVRARRAEVGAAVAQQTAQAVNDFLQNDLLAQASSDKQAAPNQKPDPDLKVRTALDRAAARLEGKFAKQPLIEASVRQTIGSTYEDLGLYNEARRQFQRALDLYRRALGEEDPKTLGSARALGFLAVYQGRYSEAESLLSHTVSIQRRVLGPNHPDTLASMSNLALAYEKQGRYSQAEALETREMEIRRRISGPDDPLTLKSMNNLALVYYDQGKFAQAETVYRQLVEARRRILGPDHPDTAKTMNNLALIYRAERKDPEAEALYGQALEILRRVLGPDHPDTTLTMNNLVVTDIAQGKYAPAELLANQVVAMRRRLLGAQHPDTLQSLHNLALVYYFRGKYAQSEELYHQVIELRRRVLGPYHSKTLLSIRNLADLYDVRREYPRAEALLTETIESYRRVGGAEHPDTLGTLSDLSSVYEHQGKYALAEIYAVQALEGFRHSLGEEHQDTIDAAENLALLYIEERKFAESEPLARVSFAFRRKKQPDDPARFRAESVLGASLAGQKRFAEAEPMLLEGYQGLLALKQRLGVPYQYNLADARTRVIRLYRAWGKPERAKEWSSRLESTSASKGK